MKNTSFSFLAALITLALAGGAATATGCGGVSTSSLCEDICACERCTTNDFNACVAKGDKAAEEADAAGCSLQFEDAVACSSASVSCNNSRAAAEGCKVELAALTQCSSTLSVFGKSDCELAADQVLAKFKSCPVPPKSSSGGGGPEQVECSETVGALSLCQAAAIVQASCDCIGGGDTNQCTADQAKSFSDAISICH